MVACFFNKPRILTTLIKAGADLVPRNNEGLKNKPNFDDWIFFDLYLGKDAYDVAVEKEFDECKEIVARALEKRGIKAGVKPNQTTPTPEKLTDDVEKLKIKR